MGIALLQIKVFHFLRIFFCIYYILLNFDTFYLYIIITDTLYPDNFGTGYFLQRIKLRDSFDAGYNIPDPMTYHRPCRVCPNPLWPTDTA